MKIHLSGRSPMQGTVLCAVVESLYSLENLMAITGDASPGNRLEKIAYKSRPSTFSGDMWAHQYDQQPNQVMVNLEHRVLDHQRTGIELVRSGAELDAAPPTSTKAGRNSQRAYGWRRPMMVWPRWCTPQAKCSR